ncbi:hypothetical protein [Methylobacterium sp. B1]|uniref:hypothetical protein n=1 Tax=Methylobacterium sp. B1 TaxID=91459 RepID=UPI000344EF8C|nr:hypothetical protein [Methylobacterium sp. B1]
MLETITAVWRQTRFYLAVGAAAVIAYGAVAYGEAIFDKNMQEPKQATAIKGLI